MLFVEVCAFNFGFPVKNKEGHVNITDYSYKGTASILFDFSKMSLASTHSIWSKYSNHCLLKSSEYS